MATRGAFYDPTDSVLAGILATNGPALAEKEPTPEQRIWAFDRVFPALTDVASLEMYMQHAEKLARWVANGAVL